MKGMKVVAQNRKARFDYEILETVEAGMMLTGSEVKSCRAGHVSMSGSYMLFAGDTPVLRGATISPYASASVTAHDPLRDRVLLLRAAEIERLRGLTQEKGVTIIPLEIHAGKYIKVLIGVGRGRKRVDKRNRIKERDIERDMRRGSS